MLLRGTLNLTYLALNFSHYVNGVAMRHGEVSRRMFGGYTIDAITNGVHVERWTSEPFRTLFDRYISGWRRDNFSLRYAVSIPHQEIGMLTLPPSCVCSSWSTGRNRCRSIPLS